MKTHLKKLALLSLSLLLILLNTSCGKTDPAAAGTPADETTAADAAETAELTAAPAEKTEEESSTEAAPDLSALPANLLGQNVKPYEEKYISYAGDTYFKNYFQYEIIDLFPDIFYLTSSIVKTESETETTNDAVFETLYTSAETELYPQLKTGLTYRDYAAKFAVSPCEYKEEYCSYTATFPITVNEQTATVYLFFFHEDSVCHSILITVKDKLDFSTLNVKEQDRDKYPVTYIGQSASEMQEKFKDAYVDLSGYDTDLRKHVYLGVTPEEPYKPAGKDALVIGVHQFNDEWESVPGIRNGDSAPGAGYEAYKGVDGESFYYDTFLIGGFFAETYVYIQDDNFAGFEFLCKQLYDM